MTKEKFRIPAHIKREETKRWGRDLFAEFDLSDAQGRWLVVTAMECHQRMRSAAEELDRGGLTIVDRYGKAKVSPLVAVERDSRAALIQALRALNLDASLAPKG
jgi:phage terminase small subunit